MLVHSTDITIHAKSMQLHKKCIRKYSIWAPLEPSRGDQNESPSHLGACRVPLPPKWVTRRCHSSRFPHVLCPLLGALLSQSASKDGPRFDKIGKVVHPSWSADKFWKMLGMSRNSGLRTPKIWILFESGGNLHIPANQPSNGKIPPQTDSIWRSRAVFLRLWAWLSRCFAAPG